MFMSPSSVADGATQPSCKAGADIMPPHAAIGLDPVPTSAPTLDAVVDLPENVVGRVLCKCLAFDEASAVALQTNDIAGMFGVEELISVPLSVIQPAIDALTAKDQRRMHCWRAAAIEASERQGDGPRALVNHGLQQMLAIGLSNIGFNFPASAIPESSAKTIKFSLRLESNKEPLCPDGNNVPGFEAKLKDLRRVMRTLVPDAECDMREHGSIILVCRCAPEDGWELPESLRDTLESGWFAGHKVLPFQDGTPSPRVDGYEIGIRVPPETIEGIRLLMGDCTATTGARPDVRLSLSAARSDDGDSPAKRARFETAR